MLRTSKALALAAAVITTSPILAPALAQTPKSGTLVKFATTNAMIWNAVAVDGSRVFVAGPRWAGGTGPQLAIVTSAGRVTPYPDAGWNNWQAGKDPAKAFVNINAIHLDRAGGLWVVDTGSPQFGGDPLPAGAKLVRIVLATNKVDRVIPLGAELALPGSYIDDIRFNGDHAYLTDAGKPGLLVLDLASGHARRVLDGHPAAIAREGRPIVVAGDTVRAPDGTPLKVNSDPLEVSADGKWLHFGPLEGPWSKISTALLDDPTVSAEDLSRAVEPWIDLPPVGGTALAPDGSLYFADLASSSVKRRHPDGQIETLISDPVLHWVDAPFLADDGRLWLPVPQMDRAPLFHGGRSAVRWPIALYYLETRK